MDKTFLRVPHYWMDHLRGSIKTQPLNLTVSTTFECNSRCATCNIWKKNSSSTEFSLDEFSKTFDSMDDVYWLTISGGEPMLRSDITDIIESAYTRIHPRIINIPTNALVKDTVKKIQDILSRCPNSEVVVNVSIDGIGAEDDGIRGVLGAYDAARNTIKKLKEIEAKNLVVGVHTVISKHNYHRIPEIFDTIMNKLKPDSYVTEVAEERVELENIGSGITPSSSEYAVTADFLSHELDAKSFHGLSKKTYAFRKQYYQLTKQVLRSKQQAIPCYAGIASAQITPYGDVWACCVRGESIGNLREKNYDFKRIWASEEAARMRASIKNRECACPLANAHYTSMLMHPQTMLKVALSML